MGALTAACLAVLLAGGYSQWQVTRLKVAAREVFYAMKALDVDIANLERTIAQSGNLDARAARLQAYTRRRRDVQNAYDNYLERLNLYDARLTQEEQLILRITRVFGESELAAPTDYIENVRTYIRKWQASDRYERAIARAERMGYVRPIAEEFVAHHLPPQFFYLALQESKLDPLLSGPPTTYGITKGMWQLMPETAAQYGLTIGPLANLRGPDPGDERHDWLADTRAAAGYIKDMYSMDAQASGLLVIVGYNWGEGKIFELLRSMPANPEERNFWKLLENHRG